MRQTLPVYSIFSQFVTRQILYTLYMNTPFPFFLNTNPLICDFSHTLLYFHALLSVGTHGFFWLLGLFIFSFAIIHIAKLVLIGWNHQEHEKSKADQDKSTTTHSPEKEENKAPADNPQEPIYYIVERKTKRAKSSYGEPKQIRFK